MFGMDPIPPAFTRPLWRDPFFWLVLAMLGFWALVLRYLFL
jgi:hypothetical protein